AGSTRRTAERRFADSTFPAVGQVAEVRYDGFGVSGSVLIGVAPGLTIAGWARADNRLRAQVGDSTIALTDLPRMAGAGLLLAPSPRVRFAGSRSEERRVGKGGRARSAQSQEEVASAESR